MKTSKTLLNIAIGALLTTGAASVMAQSDNVKLEGTTAIVPNAGNALERELSPALREQGRKKVILENKKLDLEIEKVDLDILKVQQESLGVSNPTSSNMGPLGGVIGMNGLPQGMPKVINTSSLANDPIPMPMPKVEHKKEEPVNLSGEALDDSDTSIRVLMIGGDDGNLRAKVMHNRQGGYVVGAGDTLPNGKKVVKVTAQYIEVIPPKGKRRTKIYVSGYPSEAEEKAWSQAASGIGRIGRLDGSSGLPSAAPSGFNLPSSIPVITSVKPGLNPIPGQIR